MLLRGVQVELRSLRDFPSIKTADEIGTSYTENAVLKASSYARQTGMWALADDSGLEVDALGGEPGLFSARFGSGTSDAERVKLLLASLSEKEVAERTARFRSVVVVVDPLGNVRNIAEGTCEGAIAREARGENGFGYDPIFVPEGYSQTFGELPEEEKGRISHRGRALTLTRAFLIGLLQQTRR
jgi:XTP/dITP diphosphohydrolase